LRIETLKAGETVLYSGPLCIMRDAAQKRLIQEMERTGKISVDLEGRIVFYAGPAKAPPGYPIGAIGPTTSSRMDKMRSKSSVRNPMNLILSSPILPCPV